LRGCAVKGQGGAGVNKDRRLGVVEQSAFTGLNLEYLLVIFDLDIDLLSLCQQIAGRIDHDGLALSVFPDDRPRVRRLIMALLLLRANQVTHVHASLLKEPAARAHWLGKDRVAIVRELEVVELRGLALEIMDSKQIVGDLQLIVRRGPGQGDGMGVLVSEGWIDLVDVDLARLGMQVEQDHFVVNRRQEYLMAPSLVLRDHQPQVPVVYAWFEREFLLLLALLEEAYRPLADGSPRLLGGPLVWRRLIIRGLEGEDLALVLLGLVKVEEVGLALALAVSVDECVRHGLVVNLHQRVLHLKHDVFDDLRLLLVNFDLVEVD